MLPHDLPPALAALAARGARVVAPPTAAALGVPTGEVRVLAARALEAPAGAPRLAELATSSSRVLFLVSDATRDEPREALFDAARAALGHVPDDRITIAIASGTHAPRPASSVLPARYLERHAVLVHDGADEASHVLVGTTPRGTRVHVNRAVTQHDLVVSLGRVRPHYFAGFSGGAKGLFPGLGRSIDIRQNHLLKAEPSARLGRADDNVCRLDMEDAAALVPARTYLLNAVADCDHGYVDVVAGDLVAAHREAARRSLPFFEVAAPRARAVVTSDRAPVTSSLYQAAKLLPPAGALLLPGGAAIMLAACEEGTGPLQTVNQGIYELGVRLALPSPHTVRLVSDLAPEVAAQTFATRAESVDAALRDAGFGDDLHGVVVLWRAGDAIATPEGSP